MPLVGILQNHELGHKSEVEFVNAVSAGGSVKFLPAVLISPFHSFFVLFLTKTVKIR